MPFTTSTSYFNPGPIPGLVGRKMAHYQTADARATVEGANYFGSAKFVQNMSVGDVVMAYCSDATVLYRVTAVSRTAVTATISAGLAIT